MGEPFDVSTDDTGDTSLTPTFQEPPPMPVDIGLAPDTRPVMDPPPLPPIPRVVPPPPSPLHDPRQQLLALAALGMAIGQGPRGGGAGAFQGFIQGQQALAGDQRQRYNDAQAIAEAQTKLDEQNFKLAAQEHEQRDRRLQSTMLSIQREIAKVTSPQKYEELIAGYGNMLRNAGYPRLTDDWLRRSARFVPPDEKETLRSALDAFAKNPNNADVLRDPDKVNAVSFKYKDAQGFTRVMPYREALLNAGVGYLVDRATGEAMPMGKKSTLEDKANADGVFQTLLESAKRDGYDIADPKLRLKLQKEAIATTKVKPETDPLDEEYKSLRNAKMKADAAGGEGGDILEGTPEYRRAEDIAFGKLTLQQAKGLYGFRDKSKLRAIMDKAEEINPDFNAAQFEMGYRFASNPKTQMAMVAVNRVEPNINKLIELSNKWDRTKYPTINDFLRSVKFQWGDRTVSDFGQLQTIVGDELGPALGVGSATDLKTKLGLEMAGGSKGKDNFRSGLMLVKDALNNQKRALLGQMGPYGQPTSEATPDLSGLSAGQKRTFKTGPFAGQSWTIGPDGKGKQIS